MNVREKFGERKRSLTDDCIVSFLSWACQGMFSNRRQFGKNVSSFDIQNVMKVTPIHVLLS